MKFSIVLFWVFAHYTDATFIKHQLPLNDCRTGDIDILLVADFWNDTTLQIQRFKNIVQWFFPASSNDPMRLRLHLLVHMNETHSESLIHFDDYNTTDGLTEGLDRLVTNYQFKRKRYTSYGLKCLENAEQIFNTSRRVNAKRLAIVLTFVNHERCTEKEIDHLLIIPIIYPYYTYFIRDTSIYMNDDKDQNVRVISGTEDLLNDQKMGGSLCGQCLNGWLTLRKNGSRSKLSCFFIKEFDKNASRKKIISFCDSIKAKLVTFETKEEYNFLQTHLEGMDGNNARYFVHVGLALRKYSDVYGFMWDTDLPLTFNFPMVVTNVKSHSFVKHLAWISSVRSSDDNVTCASVNEVRVYNEKQTHLVICELEEIHPLTIRFVEIKKARDEHFFRIHNKSEFVYLTGQFGSALVSVTNHIVYINNTSPIPMFMCDDYFSVPFSFYCDGCRDCSNFDDEWFCKYDVKHYIIKQKCKLYTEVYDYFSDDQRCDGYLDCSKGEDEMGCDDVCLETLCDDGTCLPSQWFSNPSRACRFVMSVNGVLPADVNVTHDNSCSEFCGNGPCIYPEELGQGIVFCDEKKVNVNSCGNHLENRIWAARCVRLKGRFNKKLGCSDLSHLENCDTFNCLEGLFKCPTSYCIPVYNINDGYPDCPYGDDENIEIFSENLFQCIAMLDSKSIYILPVHVCDNKTHCPRGDDELGCHVTCPAGFRCVAGTVYPAKHPDKITLTSLSEFDIYTKFLNLSGVDLSRASGDNFNELSELHASNCNLSSLENMFFKGQLALHKVRHIDLSFNNIQAIHADSRLCKIHFLKILNLSHNLALHTVGCPRHYGLESIDLSFTNITKFYHVSQSRQNLRFLNLSHTPVRDIRLNKSKLSTIDLRSTGLKIDLSTSELLTYIEVSSAFYADYFQLCCPQIRGPMIPGDVCFAPQDAISSCEDLLGDQVKRILLWILAVVSVCGNLTVIGFRLVFERKLITKSYRLFITNLSISDLIMGVYLFIIAGNDVYYRENYVMYESEWRNSHMCTAAGFLATLSCETSALFVLLVTLERFLVIRFPLGSYRIKRVKKYFLVLVSWVVGVVLAVVPLVYPDWAVYSSNGMCLGLPMVRNQDSGWVYSFAVFLVFNCILFFLITIGQLAIFQAMFREKMLLQSSAHSLAQRRREIMVAKNLSLVVMSNFLCWCPICVIGLMTARGHTFSQQTYGWMAVLVLPLNSAVNPVIYTLPVVYKRWNDLKNGQTRNTPSPRVTAT